MPETLLQTKLFQPRQRPGLIARPLLLQKLTDGLAMGARLTLVSAPAGFGKTTLVASWLADGAHPSAWLSLDERDQALPRFLTYFVAALQTVFPADATNELPGAQTQALLALPETPAPETLLTTLLNELARLPEPIILVLDDYHLIDSRPVDEALAFLLDHLPPSLHLVLTSREDPNLPLPRLRVRGLLTEIRAADLRFDAAEITLFLAQMTGLKLTAAELDALEQRTEGWVAGLQLAALSLQGRLDAHQFINAFAGDNRYVVDYLLDEVLRQQPAARRLFLLETSILSRLCADLCDAVSHGKPDGQSMLEQLERSNLFVTPLDDRRHWYRYHQLFADVLQAHLRREQPEAVAGLHRRASGWYAAQGLMAEAIHHALAAGDQSRAADLMELAWREMDRQRQSAIWLPWVERLPADVLANRPVLLTSYAWALLETGQLEAADSQLQAAERCLASPDNKPIIVDEQEGACVAGTLAAARTYQALALSDLAGTVTYGRRALALLPADDHFRRATPGALLGLAAWAAGDLTTAEASFAAAMSSYQQAGNLLFALTGTYFLAAMRLAQGRLSAAAAVLTDSWQLAQTQGAAALRGAADVLTGLAELQLEQNELAAAQASMTQSQELGAGAGLPRWRFRWCRAQARLLVAMDQLDEALSLLDEAERYYVRGPVPDVRPLATERVNIWLTQGRLNRARQWAEAQGLTPTDELSYLREQEHLCLARILIAQGDVAAALALLARLQAAAEQGERQGSVMAVLILQTLAHEAAGNMASALPPLQRALALAEPEGYIRLFISEGPPLVRALKAVAAGAEPIPVYWHRLLLAARGQAGAPPKQPLVEPLSERELEILGLLAQGLTNRQIADQLYLALSTVKGHNRNIFSKLQATRRTEAIARARDLGLLPD